MPFTSSDPFRSERLLYRAVRFPEDDELFQAINEDRIGYVNSNGKNTRLPGAADASKFQKNVAESLVGAIICLPAEEGSTTTPSDDNKAFKSHVTKYGTPIGQIHLGTPYASESPHMWHHRCTEIGVDILPGFQGKGYGSEAITWALDYAFRRIGMHRVSIRAFGWNEGAVRLYERIGFKVEGRNREALWHEGRWWDGVDLGMLEGEWAELQKRKEEKKGESKLN